jgi:3-hydroxyacyl-CoA dehydrogenase
MSNFIVRRVAVLGAGVMGAQIAAHLVNAGVTAILFDLPAKEGPKNGIAAEGDRRPEEAEPGAARPRPILPTASSPANYEDDLELLRGLRPRHRGDRRADGLEARPVPQGRAVHLAPTRSSRPTPRACRSGAVRGFDAGAAQRFCGVHFFNPPRYMHLVELIATPATDPAVIDRLEGFLTTTLGKGVRACEGHAELHRQPDRHVRHVRDVAEARRLRARL